MTRSHHHGVAFATLAAAAALALGVAPSPARAQRPHAAADTSLPVGTWRGTSRCLMGKPVCKDEVVVYHIAPESGADSVTLVANKIVAGREEEMGTLHCRFARATETLVCAMPPQFRAGEWRFVRTGATLAGGLTLADGRRMRAVRVRRASRTP